jgi:hypothetical protein
VRLEIVAGGGTVFNLTFCQLRALMLVERLRDLAEERGLVSNFKRCILLSHPTG